MISVCSSSGKSWVRLSSLLVIMATALLCSACSVDSTNNTGKSIDLSHEVYCQADTAHYSGVKFDAFPVGISLKKFGDIVTVEKLGTMREQPTHYPNVLKKFDLPMSRLTIAGKTWLPSFKFVEENGIPRLYEIEGTANLKPETLRRELSRAYGRYKKVAYAYDWKRGNTKVRILTDSIGAGDPLVTFTHLPLADYAMDKMAEQLD